MDTIRIDRFTSRVEADFACSMLQAHGLNARVSGDDAGGVHPDIPYGIGGTAIVVPREQYEEAIALLDSRYDGPPLGDLAADEGDGGPETDGDRAGSDRTADRRPGMRAFALLAATATLAVFFAAAGSSLGWW